MARNTVLEHRGRSFVSDTAKADVFIKHYASVSHHKFSRAKRKTDRDVHVWLTEDRRNPEPLGSDTLFRKSILPDCNEVGFFSPVFRIIRKKPHQIVPEFRNISTSQ
jgi:hypothetical protein